MTPVIADKHDFFFFLGFIQNCLCHNILHMDANAVSILWLHSRMRNNKILEYKTYHLSEHIYNNGLAKENTMHMQIECYIY